MVYSTLALLLLLIICPYYCYCYSCSPTVTAEEEGAMSSTKEGGLVFISSIFRDLVAVTNKFPRCFKKVEIGVRARLGSVAEGGSESGAKVR